MRSGHAPPLSFASCFSESFALTRFKKSSLHRDGCTCSTRTWMRFGMMRPLCCAEQDVASANDRVHRNATSMVTTLDAPVARKRTSEQAAIRRRCRHSNVLTTRMWLCSLCRHGVPVSTERCRPVPHLLVNLDADGALRHVPHHAGLAVVVLVGHALQAA